MILFVWFIVFNITLLRADDDDDFDGDRDIFALDNDFPDDICPCWPRGDIRDILSICEAAAGGDSQFIDCGALFLGFGTGALQCGADDNRDLTESDFTSPIFATLEFPGIPGENDPVGICVRSPDGIFGILRLIFEIIGDFIDDLGDCFGGDDDRRRLNTGSMMEREIASFEYFIGLLEFHGDANELLTLLFQKGGLAQLAMTMKQGQQHQGTKRRLLDDDDDFDECGFAFLSAIFGDPSGTDIAENPFGGLITALLAEPDCETEEGFDRTPVLCILDGVLSDILRRRRLIIDTSRRLLDDSGDDDGEDGFDGIGTSVFLLYDEQDVACFTELNQAREALDRTYSEEGCSPREPFFSTTPNPNP